MEICETNFIIIQRVNMEIGVRGKYFQMTIQKKHTKKG